MMAERDPAEQLDEMVEAILAGARAPGGADASLTDLLGLAADLRGLPNEEFRERLSAALTSAAARAKGEPDMTMTATMPLRAGFHTVTPYLRVERIAALLDFVTRAFGAVETLRHAGSAGGLHAEARIRDSMLMMGGYPGMAETPAALHLYVEDADAVYAKALAAGAVSLRAPVDQPYGDREASVKDPTGNHWYIATHTVGPAGGHRPEGLRAVTPYLHPRGAARLIEFLQAAFGAEEATRHQSPHGIIHHAKVRVGDSIVEMGEAHDEWQPMPTAFYLYVDDVDGLHERAARAGATSVHPPTDQPYGDRTAHVEDPFGNTWFLATPMRRADAP